MQNSEDVQSEGTGKRTRVLTERAQENHTAQVRKYERTLRELKHQIEEETLIYQELQDYSDVIVLDQCLRRTESAISKYSRISQDFIDFLKRANTEETLMQASTERFIRETVITKTEIFLQHIQKSISKTKEMHPENSEFAISQLEPQPSVNPKIEPQSMLTDPRSHLLNTSKVKAPSSAANSRRSKHSSSVFSSLSSSGLIMQQRAKAEAAKAKLKFVNLEANLQNELVVLTAQKEAAVAEAELNAMLEETEGSSVEDLSEIQQERTKSFVREQNLALHSSEHIPSQIMPALPEDIGSLEPQPGQVPTKGPLPGQFSFTSMLIPGHVDILPPPPEQEHRHYKSTPMNPNAPSFLPELTPSRLVNEPAQSNYQNHGMASELTKFLLKRDLLMSRFSSFNDRPENYSLWKTSFRAVVGSNAAGRVRSTG
ncbi:uncharacterized protein LOC134254438 [Saccostrea cucullata]|uniref:uncharacterized protein LOC134254438 n=1 Tax=Saccostrea cuccullata TaxID=36930 RepID=UPI002ED2A8F3